ncbi:anti-sigma factor domain-containing protein [Mediterraneibacter gnavus]|uniref:anti-sigma factor domain-containing protein n=1 Tax=Mediterraneibacter gnavus TaxID=33038 RepID=UPI0036D2F873
MYHKVIVMEIKETYALVMAEDGQILRIVYKDGMKVGDRIYILEEDILKKDSFKEENHASIIPFAERKKSGNQHKTLWKKMVAVAAACALFVTSFAVLSKPEKAYAMVSVDGEKAVEVVLNQKNRVKEADSKNDSLTREEKKKIKGEKVETIKNYFSQDLSGKETIIVGYAFLKDESEEERAALQRRLEKTFGTEHLLYLAGDKEDVENAKKAGKSLGIYLADQILAGEDFNKVVNEVTEEEILELLEKNPSFIENPALKKSIQEKLSDYEDADDLEKEEEADHDESEDILEQQNEKQEEQGETNQTDETDKSGDSKDADEPDATDEPENPDDERKEEETESIDQSKETVDNDEEDVSESSIELEEED